MIALNKILKIARFTFLDILKSKVLYNICFLGIGLVIATYVAFQFTYGTPHRVALNLGFGLLTLSSVCIALFFGINLLRDEINNRTIYMIISRPVSRDEFMMGKCLGLSMVLLLNMLILALLSMSVYLFAGGDFNYLIFWQLVFIYLEALIVMYLALLFSLITNHVLSLMYSIFIYFSGYAINEVFNTSFVKHRPVLHKLLKIFDYVLPSFYNFDIKDDVLYKSTISQMSILTIFSYGVLFIILLNFLIGQIFKHKELN